MSNDFPYDTAEDLFKQVVQVITEVGGYPSPKAILTSLGSKGRRRNLSGRQCRWREEVLTQLGWTHRGDTSRFYGDNVATANQKRRRRFQWQRPGTNSAPLAQ